MKEYQNVIKCDGGDDMTLKEYLSELFASLTGKAIVIGVKDKKLLKILEDSKILKQCHFLNSESPFEQKKSKWSLRRHANISVDKFRKIFKKKRISTIVCDIKEMKHLLKTFAGDSVYICKGKIYYYGTSKKQLDIPLLKEKYHHYKVTYEEVELKNAYVLIIDVSKAKTNRLKQLWYRAKELFNSTGDAISDFLVN